MSEWSEKCDVMQLYDLTAHIYDMRYEEEQTEKIEVALESINMNKQQSVLDIGCGTGLLFDYVADEVEAVVGLDTSRKTLIQAKKRARKFANVHLILADADSLPLNEDIFHYAFAITLIQNMPSPAKTLSEVKRVTREDAIIVITGLKRKFYQGIFKGILRNAGLHILAVRDKRSKSHVAVCTKTHH